MELHHLRYFLAVAENGGFGRAAARLHMAQPPLSRQVAALERELGVELIDRSRRRIRLTRAGEVLREDGTRILDELNRATARCQAEGVGGGPLRIDFVPTTFTLAVPEVLRVYQASTPGGELRLTERRPDEVVRALDTGETDAGFVLQYKPRVDEPLRRLTLLTEPLVAVVPVGHGLAGADTIDVRELAGEDFVLNEPNPRGGMRETIDELCRDAGFEPRLVGQPWLQQTTLGLVGAGFGVTLTTRSAGRAPRADVRFLALRGCGNIAAVELLWNADTAGTSVGRLVEATRAWSSSHVVA